MSSVQEKLAEFFADYEARTNRALADPPEVDTEATAAAFADCFIGALSCLRPYSWGAGH